MTAKSITFGHAAAVHAAPIEDALTSLIQAGGTTAMLEAAMRADGERLGIVLIPLDAPFGRAQ